MLNCLSSSYIASIQLSSDNASSTPFGSISKTNANALESSFPLDQVRTPSSKLPMMSSLG